MKIQYILTVIWKQAYMVTDFFDHTLDKSSNTGEFLSCSVDEQEIRLTWSNAVSHIHINSSWECRWRFRNILGGSQTYITVIKEQTEYFWCLLFTTTTTTLKDGIKTGRQEVKYAREGQNQTCWTVCTELAGISWFLAGFLVKVLSLLVFITLL